jgi:hypothetical protein
VGYSSMIAVTGILFCLFHGWQIVRTGNEDYILYVKVDKNTTDIQKLHGVIRWYDYQYIEAKKCYYSV